MQFNNNYVKLYSTGLKYYKDKLLNEDNKNIYDELLKVNL